VTNNVVQGVDFAAFISEPLRKLGGLPKSGLPSYPETGSKAPSSVAGFNLLYKCKNLLNKHINKKSIRRCGKLIA
jgi:hypothetical protein